MAAISSSAAEVTSASASTPTSGVDTPSSASTPSTPSVASLSVSTADTADTSGSSSSSAAGTSAATSSAAGPIAVRVLEAQRHFPIVGWSKKLLPTDPGKWLSVDGKASIAREDITPGAGFKWKTDWNFEVKDGVTDDKGWMYALDFQWKFVAANRLTDSVRKRVWVRYKVGILDDNRPTPPGTPRGGSATRRSSRSTSRNSNSSEDTHNGDDDEEAKRPRTIVVPVYENQRFFPLRGWSEKLLPTDVPTWMNDKDEECTKEIASRLLESGWRWLDPEWKLIVDINSTDADGWTYAVDFPQAEFQRRKESGHFVRRRKWIRKKTSVANQFSMPIPTLAVTEVPGYTSPVPYVLARMQKFLVTSKGLEEEGIFRVIADDKISLHIIREQLNTGTFNTCSSPHLIAHLIKLWFAELPEPILNSINIDSEAFLKAGENEDRAGHILNTLPEPEKSIMEWLCDLCLRVMHATASNKMTIESLSLAFGPYLWPKADKKTARVSKFFQWLITYRKGELRLMAKAKKEGKTFVAGQPHNATSHHVASSPQTHSRANSIARLPSLTGASLVGTSTPPSTTRSTSTETKTGTPTFTTSTT